MKLNYRGIFLAMATLCLVNGYSQDGDSTEVSTAQPAVISRPATTPTPSTTPNNTASEGEEESNNLGPVFEGASVSLSMGLNMYYGDLADYNHFPRTSQFGDHFKSGFKFSIAREIKWGLSGQLSFQHGKLKGTRKTGKQSSTVSFRNNFHNITLQLRYPISDALFKKSEYSRIKVYGTFGMGAMWYRTQMFDSETFGTKDYEGYVEVDGTTSLAQKTLSDKTGKAKAWVIPYGIFVTYKMNYKMDLHFDFTQASTTTDRLDAFDRDWTARDKYNYIGIGITYNFNRSSSEDAPKVKPKKVKEPKPSSTNTTDNASSNSNEGIRKSIFGKKKKKKSEDDELLNVKLKLFETQLKLFEMQYLLND